jgi:hypothetical protein
MVLPKHYDIRGDLKLVEDDSKPSPFHRPDGPFWDAKVRIKAIFLAFSGASVNKSA